MYRICMKLFLLVCCMLNLQAADCCVALDHLTSNSLNITVYAKYCDQPVCLSVCVCVCLSVSISLERMDQSSRNFVCRSPVAVARSSSSGIALRYVLPVLWMKSRLEIMGTTPKRGGCTVQRRPWMAWRYYGGDWCLRVLVSCCLVCVTSCHMPLPTWSVYCSRCLYMLPSVFLHCGLVGWIFTFRVCRDNARQKKLMALRTAARLVPVLSSSYVDSETCQLDF